MKILYLIVFVAFALLFISACTPQEGVITISREGEFSSSVCSEKGFSDKIVMIESKYCSHCQETKPIFLSAIETRGAQAELVDVAEPEGQLWLEDNGVQIQFTPTFIFGCKYYVGAKSEDEYIGLINEFFDSQN